MTKPAGLVDLSAEEERCQAFSAAMHSGASLRSASHLVTLGPGFQKKELDMNFVWGHVQGRRVLNSEQAFLSPLEATVQ